MREKKRWREEKHIVKRIEENEPAKLNKKLETFYTMMQKSKNDNKRY